MRPSDMQNGHRYRVILEDIASGPNHLVHNSFTDGQPSVVSVEEIPPEISAEPSDDELILVEVTGGRRWFWKDTAPSDGRKGWTNGSFNYLQWDQFLVYVNTLGGSWRVFNVVEET